MSPAAEPGPGRHRYHEATRYGDVTYHCPGSLSAASCRHPEPAVSQSPHQPPVTPPPAQPSRGFRAWIRRFRTALAGGAGISAGASITVLVTTYLPHGVTSGINALTGPSVP